MSNDFQFLMYRSSDGDVSVNAVIRNETVWLSQKGLAELFGVEIPAISKHLANIFEEGELSPDSTVSKLEIVQNEGARSVKRKIDFYNLDAIISDRGIQPRFLESVKDSVSAHFAHTAGDGKTYQTLFYNPDAIISDRGIQPRFLESGDTVAYQPSPLFRLPLDLNRRRTRCVRIAALQKDYRNE